VDLISGMGHQIHFPAIPIPAAGRRVYPLNVQPLNVHSMSRAWSLTETRDERNWLDKIQYSAIFALSAPLAAIHRNKFARSTIPLHSRNASDLDEFPSPYSLTPYSKL
jgi:hypothetical protein